MQISILGKRWRLRWAANLANRGDCDPPNQPGKEIRISTTLRGEEKLEVILHELLHAAGWHIDEAFVECFARDAAKALWRLGYRENNQETR